MANVFYSTFLNVFYACHVFYVFNVFFYFPQNVFYIYGLHRFDRAAECDRHTDRQTRP